MSDTWPTIRRGLAAVVALALASALVPWTAAGRAEAAPARTSVIVRATAGMLEEAQAATVRAGGRVVVPLPLVDGFEAAVPPDALQALRSSGSIHSVTRNTVGRFEDYVYDDTSTASSFARTSQATEAWGRDVLGRGVGVAVLDTGVSPMPDFAGRLVHGPDLSGEGSTIDSYGHGTVMAGVIGGSGADSAGRSGGAYTGVAPGATIVAVKAAGRNGVVDVSTILQGMHWVAAHRQQYNIRVLNLAWGTSSTQHHSIDPLNYAVQRLWREGIVVVVSAGNSGPHAQTVRKPGDDPLVLTVGAYDDKQNIDVSDDALTAWSSRGPTAAGVRKPDLLAPGRTLVAPRSYGSRVEAANPKALLPPSYIKGSGTSQAAAVVSGLAALLLEADPTLTPDAVKARLTGTALPIPGTSADAQGAGRVRLGAALASTAAPATQGMTATGLGSLEASRGGLNVETDCGADGVVDLIRGEIDVRCEPWHPDRWTASSWDTAAWMAGPWDPSGWTSAHWTSSAWTGGSWTGGPWSSSAWTGSGWTSSAWTSSAWTSAHWTSAHWTNAEWTSAEYGEFLTAFWGNRPPAWRKLPGEVADPDQRRPAAAGRH